MTRKKLTAVIAVILIVVAVSVTGTIAYFTDEATAHNVITTGGVKIKLIEKTVNADGTVVNWENGKITGAMPGVQVVKRVSVSNIGASDAWIRISLNFSIKSASGADLPLTFGTDEVPVLVLGFASGSGWTGKQTDEYYYYTQALATGAETGILLESVTLAPNVNDEYQGCTINVVVNAQAVQSKNNGSTWQQAAGWPENN